MPAKFHLTGDADSHYSWWLEAENHERLAESPQKFPSKEAAKEAIDLARSARVSFDAYEDQGHGFHWRAQAPNGKIVAESSKGFPRMEECRKALQAMEREARAAQLLDEAE